jgi:type II secretory pathway pseudopilin PulG
MIALLIAVILIGLVTLFVFIQLAQATAVINRQRTALYDAVLREHRYWHLCRGGLGVDNNGAISHFSPDEGEDYDAKRKVRL